MQGKKVLAKAPGHVIELNSASPIDAAVTVKNGSGPNTLAGIRFQGKKTGLELGESAETMQSASTQ
jgi:hypothetical protein